MAENTAPGARRLAPGERATVDRLIYSPVELHRLMSTQYGTQAARLIAKSPAARDYLASFAARPVEVRRAVEVARHCARVMPGGKVGPAYAVTALIMLTLGRHEEAHTLADLAVLAAPEDPYALKVHHYSETVRQAYAKGKGAGEAARQKLIQTAQRNRTRLTAA
jgi:hypothetical protein